MEKFVIIDGNAMLHRAFHALPPLTDKEGNIVNAVYGFFSMFLKILEDVKPHSLVVCFDRPKPTFRQTLYVGYHATRPKMSDDLVPQVGIVHEILEKGNISVFEVDGYEADDLIGTLASQAQRSKLKNQNQKSKLKTKEAKGVSLNEVKGNSLSAVEVIIVSGDRDMLQLVNSHVKVLAPVVGITNMILYDGQKVEEKYGIKPTQIIDYKALVGDASDNYPGVTGIGPKTAQDLLQKYGSLEKIYESLRSLSQFTNSSNASVPAVASGEPRDTAAFRDLASGIPPKIAEKLSIDAEQAALCKKLATIVTDAPIKLDIEKCSIKKIDKKGIQEAFERLGFKSLLKRLNGDMEVKEESQEDKKDKKKDEQLGLL